MKRAVLNTTSTKKSDTLPSFASSDNPESTPANGSLLLRPNPNFFGTTPVTGAPNITLWTPYSKLINTGNPNTTRERTASEIYARGIAENITLDFNDGTGWRWRRIAFCLKGNVLRQDLFPATYYDAPFPVSSTRLLRNLSQANSGSSTSFNQYVAIRNNIFRGTISNDFNNLMDAPIDTTRITLISDKTRTLMSGNASTRIVKRKVWTPLNKTIVYDDNENGTGTITSRWSTTGKPGMGDVYILDMFATSLFADTTSRLAFNPTTTVYWHER